MTEQEATLISLCRFLDKANIPYMIIGGIANAIWGVPRSTLDIDVTIWPGEQPLLEWVNLFSHEFKILADEPLSFVEKTRVLPMISAKGVRIDLIFGMLPFECDAINRAVVRKIRGQAVKFCTPEDLILHKIISQRSQDLDDVEKIISQQSSKLDRSYLDIRVKELSELLERPEIWSNYLKWLTA